MKRKSLYILLVISTILTGCCLSHDFTTASCTQPQTCTKCGETEGEPLEHTWVDATCTEPKQCSVCNLTEGNPLGHTYSNATCTEPQTCTVCGATTGKPLSHVWTDATFENPKTCELCGLTEGEPKEKTRTKEEIDAAVQAVIDEIYRQNGIDPATMQSGHIDAPPPEGGTPSTGDMGDYQLGESGVSERLKGEFIK